MSYFRPPDKTTWVEGRVKRNTRQLVNTDTVKQVDTPEDYISATERLKGKRVRLLGKHPFAGDSAEVLAFDGWGMRVKLLRGDAMNGHECYVTNAKEFRQEREGLDW